MSGNKRYDLIILDLNMPILDGYGAAPMIKLFHQERELQEPYILGLSAFIDSEI